MQSSKRIPLVSLTLLVITHAIFGWQLYAFMGLGLPTHNLFAAHSPTILVWVVVIIADILLAMALSTPWTGRKKRFISLFKTDTRAFLVAVILAFLCVVIITWLYIFVHILVVIAAGLLVRIDTQTARWSYREIFWLVAIASIVGLGLGILAQKLLMPGSEIASYNAAYNLGLGIVAQLLVTRGF